ncbi:unnamed protein product [Hermetia illucens]|uniref:Uncharacterized protein n=1 Tax=Hermetia illucens TaxID=343691 RepID=A0A7R8UWB3_HERIL|nr:unnamed protein product [Hermetia illucens]
MNTLIKVLNRIWDDLINACIQSNVFDVGFVNFFRCYWLTLSLKTILDCTELKDTHTSPWDHECQNGGPVSSEISQRNVRHH